MGPVIVLASVAARLNREAGSPALPALFFLTDEARTPDPIAIAARLPARTALVYRHFGAPDRALTARRLAAACRRHGLFLLIAADPELATRVRAHGVHWPEKLLPTRRGDGLVTAAAHSAAALARAASIGVDAVLLAPVFPTCSPSGKRPLGLFRASQMAQRTPLPVIALGGVNAGNCEGLIGRGFAGLAAVDALAQA